MTAIVVTDAQGQVLEWNRGAEELFGYHGGEARGMSVTKLIAGEEDSLEHLLAGLPAEDRLGPEQITELLAMRKDASVFSCELSGSRFETTGEGRWILVFRDIAERSRAELALKESEDKYRALALYAPVGIFESDALGICTFINRRWTEITGITYDQAVGQSWAQAMHPDDVPRIRVAWHEASVQGTPFSLEFRFLLKEGGVAWVRAGCVPLRDPHGVLTGYLGSIVDVTESRRALEALATSEANFRSLVERAPFGVVVTRERNIVYVNRTLLELVGYDDVSELLGRPLLETFVHPEALAHAYTRLIAIQAGVPLSPMPLRCMRRDGGEIYVEGASTFLMFDGEHSQMTVARDVTDRERSERLRLAAERATRESLREKEVLLKEIHHRVKNNLQVIISLINLQASKLEDPATRFVFEETRNRVHAIALLHERLYGSKNLGRIDMRDYLTGLVSDLTSTNFASRSIQLTVEAEELYFEMDSAVPIGLIVNELVTNAHKHAFPPDQWRDGGHVTIALQRADDDILIVVADDGIGYPEHLDPETSSTLGLLLITSLSQQLGGDVTFTTTSAGARCVVRFPNRSTHSSVPVALDAPEGGRSK
ncbi:MAG: putative sensory transduction histidine kinase [Myxococcaceae bacterium]|nr:putative sensory transduction histidine kinase [Myxococcaceae bacterium]